MKIVLLHGLFMNKLIMQPLGLRLQRMDCQAICMSYTSTRANKDDVFDKIDAVIADEKTVLAGHSLGGLVIHDYLRTRKVPVDIVPSVITMGTPHQGAKIAADLERLKLDKILGTASQFGLLPHQHEITWDEPQKLGSIAGNVKIGARVLVDRMWGDEAVESDGTVSVGETQIAGMTDHLIVKQTHTSMIYSRQVAEQIRHFSRHQAFRPI